MQTRSFVCSGTFLVASLISSLAFAADKETPSSVDMQKHSVAIGNAINQASAVQQLVAAYRLRTNSFPSNNADANVKAPTALASPDVRSITVGSGGIVTVALTATSGNDGGTIVFSPVPSSSDENALEWKCTSPSYSTIADDTGGVCEYSKLP